MKNKTKSIKSIILQTDQRRINRAKSLLFKFAIFIFMPTLISLIYYTIIATNFYESEAKFIVHVGNTETSKSDLTAESYILSREALLRLDQDLGFISTFQSKKIDFFNRLSFNANFEQAYRHYLKQVKVSLDPISGIVTLKVKAPTAYKARAYVMALLRYSDETIIKISDKFKVEQLNFAKQELNNAETRLAIAKGSMVTAEETSPDITTSQILSTSISLKIQLEKELAQAKIKYNQLKSLIQPTSPQIVALEHKINYLQTVIQQENKKILENKANNGQRHSAFILEQSLAERDFAEEAYRSAANFLETARNELLRQYHYLAVIVPPNMPDAPSYPCVVLSVLTIFTISLALFSIIYLLIATIREHLRI